MNRRFRMLSVFGLSLLMLLLTLALVAGGASAAPAVPQAACLVDGGGGGDYLTLAGALADPNCNPINVAAGTYYENVTIDRDVVIAGAGATSTIVDGNGSVTNQRVMSVTVNRHVSISGLTIQHGLAITGVSGGGIGSRGYLTLTNVILTKNRVSGTTSADIGGAISPGGTGGKRLVMNDCVVSHNSADRGGGIFHNGTLVVKNTLFYSNSARASGGLNNYGTAELENVTFSANYATTSGSAIATHGSEGDYGTTVLTNCTFFGNSGSRTLYSQSDYCTTTLVNTVMVSGGAGNCYGSFTSLGYNVEDGDTCLLRGTQDQHDTDALLAPLADNGGFSWTHAITSASPATDAGNDAVCPATDQRGRARPALGKVGGGLTCDVGAYEYQLLDHLSEKVYLPLVLRGF
jgi:predicted outer membrane repeat protein